MLAAEYRFDFAGSEYHPTPSDISANFSTARVRHFLPLVIPSKTLVFYLSDEIFAIHTPILVTIDARSTTILNIELRRIGRLTPGERILKRLSTTISSAWLASDRGLGLVAGYRAACDMALWVADYFHEFRDLCEVLHQLERKAYAAIGKEDAAVQKLARAKSESTLQKRLQQYETAHACEQALALYDQRAMLRHLLHEALQLCSPHGRLHPTRRSLGTDTAFRHDRRTRLRRRYHRPRFIRTPLDDLLVPFAQAEAIDAALRHGASRGLRVSRAGMAL